MSGLATAKKPSPEAKRNRERWKEQLLDRRRGASQRPSVRLIPAGVCARFGEARADLGETPPPIHGGPHRRVIAASPPEDSPARRQTDSHRPPPPAKVRRVQRPRRHPQAERRRRALEQPALMPPAPAPRLSAPHPLVRPGGPTVPVICTANLARLTATGNSAPSPTFRPAFFTAAKVAGRIVSGHRPVDRATRARRLPVVSSPHLQRLSRDRAARALRRRP
jgi:hypothetical protein